MHTSPLKVLVMLTIVIVCELFAWKSFKKTGIIWMSINMYFMLITVFNYQIISLISLFFFFVSLLGMALNLVYRASND